MAYIFDSSNPASPPSTSSTQPYPELSIPAPTIQLRNSILITMGPCMLKGVDYRCNCTSGSCISELGATASQASCKKCRHSMSMHSSYSQSEGGLAQNRSLNTPRTMKTEAGAPQALSTLQEYCPRENTVKGLAELLDEEWIVCVRGTPSSGKTILATLLRNYYKARGDCAVLIYTWKKVEGALSHLTRECKKQEQGNPGIQVDMFCSDNIILIIDEAQDTYSDIELWSFIKSQNDRHRGPKICLFSSYGSPDTGMVPRRRFTPPFLSSQQHISITRSYAEKSADICLFYNKAEFEEVVRRYCTNPSTRLNLDEAVKTYLFSITNGHPGAVKSILSYIFKMCGPSHKHGTIKQVTKDDFVKALDGDAAVFSGISTFPVYRSFPHKVALTTSAERALRKVLQYGSVPFNIKDEGMKRCFEKGWVHVESTNGPGSEQCCFLPSRLHEKYIEYYLTATEYEKFPLDKFPTLAELCKATLKRFSRKNLQQSSNGQPTIPSPRTPEAQYQDEFYRAFKSLLGNGVGISSEWSRDNGGRVYFMISGPKWGVEIIRDGDRVKDHCDRFKPGGKYWPWIECGSISDWIILDCRFSRPCECLPSEPKVWRAVFPPDYSSLCLLDCNNQEIIPKTVLMD